MCYQLEYAFVCGHKLTDTEIKCTSSKPYVTNQQKRGGFLKFFRSKSMRLHKVESSERVFMHRCPDCMESAREQKAERELAKREAADYGKSPERQNCESQDQLRGSDVLSSRDLTKSSEAIGLRATFVCSQCQHDQRNIAAWHRRYNRGLCCSIGLDIFTERYGHDYGYVVHTEELQQPVPKRITRRFTADGGSRIPSTHASPENISEDYANLGDSPPLEPNLVRDFMSVPGNHASLLAPPPLSNQQEVPKYMNNVEWMSSNAATPTAPNRPLPAIPQYARYSRGGPIQQSRGSHPQQSSAASTIPNRSRRVPRDRIDATILPVARYREQQAPILRKMVGQPALRPFSADTAQFMGRLSLNTAVERSETSGSSGASPVSSADTELDMQFWQLPKHHIYQQSADESVVAERLDARVDDAEAFWRR